LFVIKFGAIAWDDPADPQGNVQHIAVHGLTTDEVESVLLNPNGRDGRSASSGRHLRFGWTRTGKHVAVIYIIKQGRTLTTIYPVTAYEAPPY
jgi:hypothetical protein